MDGQRQNYIPRHCRRNNNRITALEQTVAEAIAVDGAYLLDSAVVIKQILSFSSMEDS